MVDGSFYEGFWEAGQKHGQGPMVVVMLVASNKSPYFAIDDDASALSYDLILLHQVFYL
jgi:hypothetical protein